MTFWWHAFFGVVGGFIGFLAMFALFVRRSRPAYLYSRPRPHLVLDALHGMLADLDAITPEQLERVESSLEEAGHGEKVIGTLHNPEARKLWALAQIYDRKSGEAGIEIQWGGYSGPELDSFREQRARNHELALTCRHLFWIQAEDDMGTLAWAYTYTSGALALKRGWQIVQSGERPSSGMPPNPFRALFGGGE